MLTEQDLLKALGCVSGATVADRDNLVHLMQEMPLEGLAELQRLTNIVMSIRLRKRDEENDAQDG